MEAPSRALIDLNAVRSNVAALTELAGRAGSAQVMAVVKADAYGHGLLPCAHAALAGGATWLGVAQATEAMALRAAGVTAPVFTWLYKPGESLAPLLEAGIDVSVSSGGALAQVLDAARATGRTARIHIKVDTGLGRAGVQPVELPALLGAAVAAQAEGAVEVVGVWSHLAWADAPDHPTVLAQAGVFADAVALARQIGFPVAMKIASPDIIHKSDMGGVKLNLNNASAVEDAYDLMMLRMRQRAPGARIEGVYIEQMCPKGREVILGVTRDPQFGPMLMFGLGGIFVEVMKDVTFNIAPITQDEAMQMLQSTKSYELLKGVRGQAQVDMVAIADALQRISQLVTEFPQIAEMDINPFMVGRVGEISVAADARITLSGDDEVPHV